MLRESGGVFETDSYSYIKKRENVLILLLYFTFIFITTQLRV